MIIYYAVLFGAGLGAYHAMRSGSQPKGIALHVVIYILVFGLIALLYTLFTTRSV